MTNIELFQYSGQHKEQLLDPYYISNTIPVIPPARSETNELVEKNTRLSNLKKNPGNYFVNTAGLKELLRQLISEQQIYPE